MLILLHEKGSGEAQNGAKLRPPLCGPLKHSMIQMGGVRPTKSWYMHIFQENTNQPRREIDRDTERERATERKRWNLYIYRGAQ